MKVIVRVFKILINIILGLLVLLGLFVIFSAIPFPGNFKVFVDQTGSMEPAIHTGSLVFVRPEASYKVGDIITRRTTDPKVTITHRIYAETKVGKAIQYETKGDANNAPDPEKFFGSDIIGKEVLAIPYVGYPVGYAKTTPGLILLIVVPAVIIIYDEINKIKDEVRKKIDYRRRIKKRQENNLESNDEEAQEKI